MAKETTKKTSGADNKSIHPNARKKGVSARKSAHNVANKARRAALYSQHTGSSGWQKDVSAWHDTIKGLSLGTA